MNAKGKMGEHEEAGLAVARDRTVRLRSLGAMTSERRAINRDVCFGIVMAVLVGVAGFLAPRALGPDRVDPLIFVPLMFVLMGFVGSLWWWRGRESWSLAWLVFLSLSGLFLVGGASQGLEGILMFVRILMQLPTMMLMGLLMFIGAKLGYRLRDRLAR